MKWPAFAVAVLLMVGVAASREPQQDGDIKKLLPDAEGIKKSPRKITKEAKEKIEKALGSKIDDKDVPQIWEARATVPAANPNEKTRVFCVTLTCKGPKGDLKIAVAVATEEHIIAAVKILENKDDKAADSKTFLGQFEGFEYSSNFEMPATALDDARKKAQAAADADGKMLAALFALTDKMHVTQGDFEAIDAKIQKEEDGVIDAAQRMKSTFADMEKLSPSYTFLQAGQIGRFTTSLKAAQKDLQRVIDATKGKKWSDAAKAMTDLGNEQCNKCHAWSRSRFSAERVKLGIGNGYFVVGHEISAPSSGPKESFQSIATTVRRAVLIVTQAK